MSLHVIKGLTIRRRILMSFAVVLGLMVVMGLIALRNLNNVEDRASNAELNSVPGLYYATLVKTELVLNYSLTAEYVGQADVLRLGAIEDGLATNGQRWEKAIQAYNALPTDDEDRKIFAEFSRLRDDYVLKQGQILKLSSDLNTKAANDMWRNDLSPLFDETLDAIQTVVDDKKASADMSMKAISGELDSAKYIMLTSFLAAGLLTFICAYYLLKAITHPLDELRKVVELMRGGDFSKRVSLAREDEFHALAFGFNRMADELTALVAGVQASSSRVSTSVSEIAATARQQQATAGQIATTTIEIGATSKEISATSKELVKTMNEVATVAEQSAALAGVGQAGLAHMGDTMKQVMEAAGSINSKLAVLNEKAANINQIVTTITKVADQTSLLSLNAAIEAEKAGEHGRGFAVVATEIRRLADQTAVATYDIEQMVKHIQSAVSAGVMGMDKFSEEVRRGMQEVQQVGGQLSHIIDQVQALAPRMESVNEGMQAQSTGAEQISHALAQLTDAAQQTVESLSQSTHAIGDLDEVSNDLRNGVLRFKLAS
jgi:methyl-accepting chemotaxis protein WspA